MAERSDPKVTLIHPAALVKGPPLPVPGIKADRTVYVTMRDGVKLAVDLCRPERDGDTRRRRARGRPIPMAGR